MLVWSVLGRLSFIICLLWLVSEITLGRLAISKTNKAKGLDRRSLRWLWIAIAVAITTGVIVGAKGIGFVRTGSLTISVTGLILIVAGLVIRWIAILTLRKYFTVNVNIGDSHQLVTSGLYRFVRHPAYSGSLLSFLGLGLTFSNWLSALLVFLPVFIAFSYRIRVEERVLTEHFGDEYHRYCSSTKRLLPLIY